jgi:hypothetical protein
MFSVVVVCIVTNSQVIIISSFSIHSSSIGEVGTMEIEQIIFSAGITIFSLGLLIISLASVSKYKNTKLLFVSLVFLVFLIKGVLLSLRLFFPSFTLFDAVLVGSFSGVFDVIILGLLFIATLKR